MNETYTGRRITADEVEAAYRETGIKPERGAHAYPNNGCIVSGCGIGVLVALTQGVKRGGRIKLDVSWVFDLTESYLSGFARGFDGLWSALTHTSPAFIVGYEDGRSAAARVFPEPTP